MDISFSLENIRVNIRTGVIIETEKNEYIFEKDSFDRFYWTVGGRIKTNESSENAAKREVREELGIEIEDIKLKAIMESFFTLDNENFHEICFYYKYKLNKEIELPNTFYSFSKKKMKTIPIQPIKIQDIIESENN